MIVIVNDHRIEIPADMTAHDGGRGPGAYDFIQYRDAEIITQECEHEPPLYTGPFYVALANGSLEACPTLDAARALIDTKGSAL